MDMPTPLLAPAPIHESIAHLDAPTEGQNVADDYQSLGFTLGRHPLSLIRERLKRMKSVAAAKLHTLPNNASIRATGIVTCRQRPATASGVVFLTLEDETGYMNIIVWASLADQQREELLKAQLLTIVGRLQREGELHHIVARSLFDHSALLGDLRTEARVFG